MPRVVGWIPPPVLRYKVNVDGAVFLAQKSTGVGVLIWDSYGQVIATLGKKINAFLGAMEVEGKAFDAGLEFARDVGVQDYILEGDLVGIFNGFRGFSTPPSLIASIVRGMEVKRMEVNYLQYHSIQMAYRVAQRLICLKYSGQDENSI
ncbi:uncharacterized protein LOC115972837 [Quercus lobata]|uniref:uncharacterized protein LOC115972837 n=1 Tax=Quercus lobata TaxID=97700 RepID=UPI0012468C5E|nr:uncharacterized protein LOC115972837 [Quercus lobata]